MLKARLEIWRPSSPHVVAAIERSLANIHWRLTPHLIKKVDQDANLWTAVYYMQSKGAWLSVPLWDRLSDINRAGLFIHEAFRHGKVVNQDPLGEEALFRLTAKIMLSLPEAGESLDRKELFAENSNLYLLLASLELSASLEDVYKQGLEATEEAIRVNQDLRPEAREVFSLWVQRLREADLNDFSAGNQTDIVRDWILKSYFTSKELVIVEGLIDFVDAHRELEAQLELDRSLTDGSRSNMANAMTQMASGFEYGRIAAVIDDYAKTGQITMEGSTEDKDALIKAIETLKKQAQENIDRGVFVKPYY